MKQAEVVGIIYNSRLPEAREMASVLRARFGLEEKGWVCAASDVEPDSTIAGNTDLIITAGGDGTIIRAAALSFAQGIPILGINMGRLGFMTELKADEALDKVSEYLEGAVRIEERFMLQVTVLPRDSGNGGGPEAVPDAPRYHALNDAVVGRGAVSRVVAVNAFIDGTHLTRFRADAVMVATATGSTGYNLSVGGPILPPLAGDFILKAVAPHVGMAPAMVVQPTSVVELEVDTDLETMLSVDGFIDRELSQGDRIRVESSPHKARFLRADPPTHFYATLTERLGFGGGQSATRAIQY